MSDHVLHIRHGGVLELAMNRAEKKNALTGAMYEALIAGFDEADASDEIAAIVITGRGGVFSAGNDIGDFMAHAGKSQDFPALRFVRRLASLETPLVAAVDGLAIGVGTTMLFHCDLVYASSTAQMRTPFVDLALVPEAAASLLMPQRLGLARANALLLLGEAMNAQEAKDAGLVNAIADGDALHALALEKAQALATKPREALRNARRLVRGDRSAILDRIEEEAVLFKKAMGSAEAARVFMAFMNKAKS